MSDLIAIWQGQLRVREALSAERLTMVGVSHLMRTIDNWFPVSPVARDEAETAPGAAQEPPAAP